MLPRLSSQQSQPAVIVAFFTELKAAGFKGDLESDFSSRLVMSTDNSVYQQVPGGILYPRSMADLQLIGSLASQAAFRDVCFAARGGGTGTNGQSLTEGVVVDLSRHMNRILDFDAKRRQVRVQAGVVKDQLNAFLKPHGLFFAPDLSTSNRATIGGMISTDASGQGSLLYGKTSDHVLGLGCVLADGTLLETRPLSQSELAAACERSDTVGAVYRQARETCYGRREQILARFPPLNRFLTGYDLAHVIDESQQQFDLGRLITGAEGSLAFVGEATLNLLPLPRQRALVNVKYDSFDAALRHAPDLVAARATAVETVDSKVLDMARQDIVWHSVSELIQDVPGAKLRGLNLVEFTDECADSLQQRVASLTAMLDNAGKQGVIGYQLTYAAADISRIWAMRKKAVGLLGATAGAAKPVAFAEDTAVPPEKLADFIAEFRQLLDNHGLHYGMFGHVDAGVLHVRPALDLCDPKQELLLREISDQVVALVAKYGGLMWGEHGKGFRSEYGPEFFGQQLFTELRRIKTAFDPANRMNPGKICTPLASEASLVSVDGPKRAWSERQIPLAVRNDFTAAMECNGNGLCFNFDPASPMCPSFRSTGDRRYSPKGRASLMREWLRQLSEQGYQPGSAAADSQRPARFFRDLLPRIANSWRVSRGEYDFNHQVYQAMQTCLACKACASQCPVKVDIPEMRSRFMADYYSRYWRPLRDHLVGSSEQTLPLFARLPQLYNWPLSLAVGRWAMSKLVGMEDAPLLSVPTLRQRLQSAEGMPFSVEQLQRLSPAERANTVLVVQDPYTSYNEADLVHDWIRLLKHLGFTPVLLPFKPNGKAAHIKGFLAQFARTAADTAQFLQQLADLGLPLVGIDPALVLCYRDEYRVALGEQRGDFLVQLPQEFLVQHLDRLQQPASEESSADKHPGVSYLLLGHCTEKTARPEGESEWLQVFSAAGLSLEMTAVGCCGMAGTYGHESANVANARAVYNLSWAPALAALSREQVLVTGYSCRSQVKRMEGSKARHPLQALLAELSA